MHGPRIKKHILESSVFRSAVFTLFAIGIMLVTVSAHAACGDPRGSKVGIASTLPFLV